MNGKIWHDLSLVVRLLDVCMRTPDGVQLVRRDGVGKGEGALGGERKKKREPGFFSVLYARRDFIDTLCRYP
jgi:hypothetical protein